MVDRRCATLTYPNARERSSPYQKGLKMGLPLLVRIRFQVLFHSPLRGSFRLSLTVLVHYRSVRSI